MSSNKQYIKVLTNDLKHRGYQWKIGLNELDPNEQFITENDCTPNALYVCEIKDFFKWINLYNNMAYVGYVTIPDDALITNMEYKIKTNKVILHEPLISLVEFVKILINSGTNINVYNYDPFHYASTGGNLDIVELLISNGANIHAREDYPLRAASLNGYLFIVELLLNHGADIHANDEEALCNASANGYLVIVECLIKYGADIHANNDQALRHASYNGHLNVIECLISHGADIHAKEDSALICASRNGNLDVVKCLINNGAVRATP